MDDMLQEVLDEMGFEDWTSDMGDLLISPNGHLVELDGVSPDGEVSPLRQLGLI